MARKRNIITSNKEIYEKFNMLNFSSEIVLTNVKPMQVERIINNINRNSPVLKAEKVGSYIVVRKINPINFSMYLK
jgi:hypothetical protein